MVAANTDNMTINTIPDGVVVKLSVAARLLSTSADTMVRRVKTRRIRCLPRMDHEPYLFASDELKRFFRKGIRSHSPRPVAVPDELGLYGRDR